jgi:lactosylceramide 4-alpha-galactosyltransferase
MAQETEEKSISWLTEKVVGVHIWNRISKDAPIYKNDKHHYNHLARNNCPFIFSIAP